MRNRLTSGLLLALIWCAGTGAFGGCNLFRPAVPEQGGTGQIVAPNYTDPDSLLETMARGMENKAQSNGLDAYIGAFSTSASGGVDFAATFDQAVLNARNETAPAWGVEEERRFYSGFVQNLRSQPFDMQWSPDPTQNDFIETTHVILHRRYQVYALPQEGDAERIAVGYADLDMVLNGTRWFLTRWTDHVDPTVGVSPQNQEDQSFSARRLDNR
jgi:hypothetical protein